MDTATNITPPPLAQLQNETPHRPEFTCFPRLCRELRNKIWEYACYDPRIIRFSITSGERGYNVENQRRLPAMLEVCSEAREEGKRYYSRCLRKEMTTQRISEDGSVIYKEDVLYINFAIDRFKSYAESMAAGLAMTSFYDGSFEFYPDTVKRFQNIIIECTFGSEDLSLMREYVSSIAPPQTLGLWPALKSITFDTALEAGGEMDRLGEDVNGDIWRAVEEARIKVQALEALGETWSGMAGFLHIKVQ